MGIKTWYVVVKLGQAASLRICMLTLNPYYEAEMYIICLSISIDSVCAVWRRHPVWQLMSAKAGAPVLIIPWAGVAGAGWAQCRVTQPGPATLLPAAITTITHRSYTPLNTYTHTSHTVQWHVSLNTDSEDPSLQRCQRNLAKVQQYSKKAPTMAFSFLLSHIRI